MLFNPLFLIFLAGLLAGMALTLLLRLVPEVVFLQRWLAAHRRPSNGRRNPFRIEPFGR